jgi:hypothetical protein
MPFPSVALAPPAGLAVVAFDGSAVAADCVLAGAGEDAAGAGVAAEASFEGSAVAVGFTLAEELEDFVEAGGVAAELADAPPRPVTYETRAFISAAFTVRATMPPAFIFAVGAFRSAVSFAGGY